ncbi:MAG: DUF190 domain-containing protein [Candidatus Manganitrophaceae bacterium]|nr:MAG: DUF190 domain-containing protein [Candidatus Manganitrophaceae bacterium]
MLRKEKAKRLTIYLDETEQWHGRALYEALIEFFQTHQVAGVSLFRGFAGYGRSRVLHTPKILRLSENLPIKLEIIESPAVIDRLLPEISQMVRKGLIELSDTEVIRSDDPEAGPH